MFSCELKRVSIGADNELMVVTSVKDKKSINLFLSKIFNDTLYTPQPEPVYKIKYSEPKNFKNLKQHSNLVIYSTGSNLRNEGTKLVKNLLGKNKFLETIDGTEHIILSENQFAKDQLFLILSGKNQESLYQSLKDKKMGIKSIFEEKYNRRQKSFLFSDARKNELESELLKKYYWNFKIPWGWEIIKDISDSNFVWLGKELPFQWISVYWEDCSFDMDSSVIADMIINFPEHRHSSIQFSDYKFFLNKGINANWYDWSAKGVWESIAEPLGGPFSFFIKYDNLNNRIFLIQTLIHYPGENKSNYLRQMELISSSIHFEKII